MVTYTVSTDLVVVFVFGVTDVKDGRTAEKDTPLRRRIVIFFKKRACPSADKEVRLDRHKAITVDRHLLGAPHRHAGQLVIVSSFASRDLAYPSMGSTFLEAQFINLYSKGDEPPFAEDLSDEEVHPDDDEDEIFERAVDALVALSTKRPFYSTSTSPFDSSSSFLREDPVGTLVTPWGQDKTERGSTCASRRSTPSTAKTTKSGSSLRGQPNGAVTKNKKHKEEKDRDSVFDERWNDMAGKLKAYRRKHGDCRVPRFYPADQSFSNWVHNQRYSKALTQKRIEILEDLGFPWTLQRGNNKEESSKKLSFKKVKSEALRSASAPRPFGTSHVNRQLSPPKASNAPLKVLTLKTPGLNLSSQVVGRKRKDGPAADASFAPQRPPNKSQTRFQGKASGSHMGCQKQRMVSDAIPDVSPSWVAGTMALSSSKEKRYATYDKIWAAKYEALKRFKKIYGHTLVPSSYPSDQPLSNWVRNQRNAYMRGELKQDRVDRLNELDNNWLNRGWLNGVLISSSSANGTQEGRDQVSSDRQDASLKNGGSENLAKSPHVAVISRMSVTAPEVSTSVDATCVAYKNHASDPTKLVLASIAWSPAPDTYRDV
jgi:hypothetical protein